MSKPKLTEQDFKDAAQIIGCEVACIKAVAEVESSQSGFQPNDEPTILFERHIFRARTKGRFDVQYPDLSNKTSGGYGSVSVQHARLNRAVVLDRNAALMSASWGKFQLMGFNYALAGYNSLQEFVTDMYEGEREHLMAFVNYVKETFLDDELRDKRWADFARKYNGPKYTKNKYDIKLAAAYKKYK